VGIGDINSTFLPKIELLASVTPPKSSPAFSSIFTKLPSETKQNTVLQTPSEEIERAKLAADVMLTQNSLALEAQLEERPLAKKQEELQGTSAQGSSNEEQRSTSSEKTQVPSGDANPKEKTQPSKTDKVARKALLKNDDSELERIYKVSASRFAVP
jgi:RNA polymerase II subunit A C-terminal domain phosphatase